MATIKPSESGSATDSSSVFTYETQPRLIPRSISPSRLALHVRSSSDELASSEEPSNHTIIASIVNLIRCCLCCDG